MVMLLGRVGRWGQLILVSILGLVKVNKRLQVNFARYVFVCASKTEDWALTKRPWFSLAHAVALCIWNWRTALKEGEKRGLVINRLRDSGRFLHGPAPFRRPRPTCSRGSSSHAGWF
jgi:hypothetical protein